MRVLTDKMLLWGSTVMRSKLKARQVRVLEHNSVGNNTSRTLLEGELFDSADRSGLKADLPGSVA